MFTEEERKIFEYSAGPSVGPQAVDPIYVLRQFVIEFKGRSLREVMQEEWAVQMPEPHEGMTKEEMEVYKQDKAYLSLQSSRAEQMMIDAARKIFEMEPFDKKTGHGSTDGDVLEVIASFLKYVS